MSAPEAPESEGTYDAGCHCGQIGLSLTLKPALPEYKVMNCNCSICRRAGYLLVYPPYNQAKWHDDSDKRVSRYKFNTKTRDHMFCSKCGVSIGIDFWTPEKRKYGISVRTIRGVDLDSLQYKKGDGLNKMEPAKDLAESASPADDDK